MTAIATEDAWMEKCLISISLLNGTEAVFHALTETVDFDLGEKDTEGKPNVAGGRVTTWKPETDSSVTFEAYAVEAGTDTGTTGKGFWDLLHVVDSSQPLGITNSRTRVKARVSFLWTNGVATTATAITLANECGRRITLANGHFISVKESFTDGILKTTAVYKTSAFNKDGSVGQVKQESTDGSAVLPAIAAYTSAATPFA